MVYEQVGDGGLTLAEVAIPNGTLYRSRPADGTLGPRYVYSLTDHLGNVRAVVPRGWNPTATPPPGQEWIRRLSFFSDYYPYGWSQPGRDMGLYRYGFQGQEKDPETDWWAFQLRMYDGRVGRWMTYDPKKQYLSPYLALGNNPASRIDPDGGLDGPALAQFFSSFKVFFSGVGNFFKRLFGGSNNDVPQEVKKDFSQQQIAFSNPSEVVSSEAGRMGKELIVGSMELNRTIKKEISNVVPDLGAAELDVSVPACSHCQGIAAYNFTFGGGYMADAGLNAYAGYGLQIGPGSGFNASLSGVAGYATGTGPNSWGDFTGVGSVLNGQVGNFAFGGFGDGIYNSKDKFDGIGRRWQGFTAGYAVLPGTGFNVSFMRTYQLFR